MTEEIYKDGELVKEITTGETNANKKIFVNKFVDLGSKITNNNHTVTVQEPEIPEYINLRIKENIHKQPIFDVRGSMPKPGKIFVKMAHGFDGLIMEFDYNSTNYSNNYIEFRNCVFEHAILMIKYESKIGIQKIYIKMCKPFRVIRRIYKDIIYLMKKYRNKILCYIKQS